MKRCGYSRPETHGCTCHDGDPAVHLSFTSRASGNLPAVVLHLPVINEADLLLSHKSRATKALGIPPYLHKVFKNIQGGFGGLPVVANGHQSVSPDKHDMGRITVSLCKFRQFLPERLNHPFGGTCLIDIEVF